MRFLRRVYGVEDFEVADDVTYKRDCSVKFRRPKWYRKFPDCPWEEIRDPELVLELDAAYDEWQHEAAARILNVLTEQ